MKLPIIVNDAPYGSERPYNALRLALQLVKEQVQVRVFLLRDGVGCAILGQSTPKGYYNIERFIKALAQRPEVGACGTGGRRP